MLISQLANFKGVFKIYFIGMIYIFSIVWAILIVYVGLLIITLKKYKKLYSTKESFLANITHDLKSPARAQINMLNMLLNGQFGELNPQQYEMIKLTCGSSKYMSNLVSNILTGYRCDSHCLSLAKSEFDIISMINLICLENSCLASEKNQKIVFHHEDISCFVFCDKLQIERVILNLISNAMTYGFENSQIDVRLNRYEDYFEFSVMNLGNPISEKKLKQLFSKFSRLENSQFNKYSTGLGLYISKRIIDLHKGKIYAKSFPDGRCVFGFKLNFKQSANVLLEK